MTLKYAFVKKRDCRHLHYISSLAAITLELAYIKLRVKRDIKRLFQLIFQRF